MLEKIAQTADYILSHTTRRPKTAIILGTHREQEVLQAVESIGFKASKIQED